MQDIQRTDDIAAAATDRYLRGMERLVKAVQELSLARDLPTVQRVVRTTARELTGADGATFVLRDEDRCFYADEDAIAPLWKGKRFPMEICISGWVMQNREPVVIPDIYQDPRIPAEAYRPTFVKSLAMVPIRRLDPIGAIGNYWARRYRPSERDVALLQALADTTALAMENVQVYAELEQRVADRTQALEIANQEIQRMSLADELTGLNNRRGFYLLADQALRNARRNGSAVCALFIDVDGLKRVNDDQGHDVGDAMIADLARAIKATFRESDILGRLGGDEFCVLAVNPQVDVAALRARLAQALRDFSNPQRPYQLSASVGAAVSEDADETLDQLLARADEAMYFEKRSKKGINPARSSRAAPSQAM
ncbi:MAG TPA: sensor domain-containing diguanylate cyclase [Nevskiaceae bacterium]|nr:sensor domain-containing diguanylate cyclase [Nevskiaceae bacterium]